MLPGGGGRCAITNPSVRNKAHPVLDCERGGVGGPRKVQPSELDVVTNVDPVTLERMSKEQVNAVRVHWFSASEIGQRSFHVPKTTMTSSTTASQTEAKQARIPLGWRDQCSS